MSALAIPEEFCRGGLDCVRVVTLDSEPWFVAADVCAALAIGNVSQAVRRLHADDLISTEVIDSMGRKQRAWVVNESGMYDLILDSRKPEARIFRRWITSEVLPAIRSTGRYGAPAEPPTRRELAEFWAEAERRAELAEARVAELEPRADAWDELASADGDFSAREAAAILKRAGIETGQNRLLRDTLPELRMVDRRGQPYARHARHLRLKPQSYEDPRTGERRSARPQVRVTVEGLRYLHRRLGGRFPLDIPDPYGDRSGLLGAAGGESW